MKAQLYSKEGKQKGQIELPEKFSAIIRPDLVQKLINSLVFAKMQPYSHAYEAGKRHSASGIISHKRHDWKGHYGHGISRIPRKIMSRRGVNFYWVGAEISSTRGGRRAHGPSLIKRMRKINKKELELALNSGLASTASSEFVKSRYNSIEKIENIPRVIEEIPEKAKSLVLALKNIFPDVFPLLLRKKSVRPGKGKLRGRKYKSTSGLLIVKSDKEKLNSSVVEVKSVSDLSISDLYPLGRLTLYTKKAIENLSENIQKDKNKEK